MIPLYSNAHTIFSQNPKYRLRIIKAPPPPHTHTHTRLCIWCRNKQSTKFIVEIDTFLFNAVNNICLTILKKTLSEQKKVKFSKRNLIFYLLNVFKFRTKNINSFGYFYSVNVANNNIREKIQMSKSLTFIEHDCANLRKVIITNYADIVEQFYRNKMFIDNFEYVQNKEK